MMMEIGGPRPRERRRAGTDIRERRGLTGDRRPGALSVFLAFALLCGVGDRALAAEPCVRSVTPDEGPAAGGVRVGVVLVDRIVSENVEVRFGDRPARVLMRVGNTLEVEVPPQRPGSVPVRVLSGGCAADADAPRFTYLAPPRLVSVHPVDPTAAGDLTVEAVGSEIGPNASLVVDGTPVPTEMKGPKRIQARIPAALLGTARHMTLQVLDPTRGLSDGVTMTLANPIPRLVSVQAPPLRAGRARAIIGLVGHGFRSASVARLDGQPLDTRLRSESYLEVVLPAETLKTPGTRSISVATAGPGGGESNRLEVLVLPPPPFGGHFVVFMSNRRGGRNHIFLLDRQTGKIDPLEEANSPSASDGYPSISADGRFIVFQSDRHRGQSDIVLFDRESRTLDLLPEANDPTAFDGFPSLSPDGRFIVFESDRLHRKPKVFLFDRETRILTELSSANEVTADDGVAAISN
jgi:hypothetical protein